MSEIVSFCCSYGIYRRGHVSGGHSQSLKETWDQLAGTKREELSPVPDKVSLNQFFCETK